MLGLAALMATALMACAGVSSAMAESTSFCSVDPGEGPEEVCPAGDLITHLHAATATGLKAVVLTSSINVECSVLYLADTVGELGSPLVLEGNFTYSNCTSGCTVSEENGPSEIALLKLGHEKADAELEFLMHVTCSGFINCRYIGGNMHGLFKGALLPFINGEDDFGDGTLTKESGTLCPVTAKLDLLVFSLANFYIAR
jgi:hypothetical protein